MARYRAAVAYDGTRFKGLFVCFRFFYDEFAVFLVIVGREPTTPELVDNRLSKGLSVMISYDCLGLGLRVTPTLVKNPRIGLY